MSGPDVSENFDDFPEGLQEQMELHREFCERARTIAPNEHSRFFHQWFEAAKGFEELMDRERGYGISSLEADIVKAVRPYAAMYADLSLFESDDAFTKQQETKDEEMRLVYAEQYKISWEAYIAAMNELKETDRALYDFLLGAHSWFLNPALKRTTPRNELN